MHLYRQCLGFFYFLTVVRRQKTRKSYTLMYEGVETTSRLSGLFCFGVSTIVVKKPGSQGSEGGN